jgi:hypothetical protein
MKSGDKSFEWEKGKRSLIGTIVGKEIQSQQVEKNCVE